MMSATRAALLAVLSLFFAGTGFAQELTQDVPRGQLARSERQHFDNKHHPKAVPYMLVTGKGFSFPDIAIKNPDKVFGIDVSHYDGDLDWEAMADLKVSFAYVKASQGETSWDGYFKQNWEALGDLPLDSNGKVRIYRGAYHFFSADGDPKLQAINFLYQVKYYGYRTSALAARELPPVVDIEWDCVRNTQGKCAGSPDSEQDKWDALGYTPQQIVDRLRTFSDIVESVVGVKPIIYSGRYWWKEHIEDHASELAPDALKGFKIWIADYGDGTTSSTVILNDKPRIAGDYSLWQFTDSGKTNPPSGDPAENLDVNVYHGASFADEFGHGLAAPTP